MSGLLNYIEYEKKYYNWPYPLRYFKLGKEEQIVHIQNQTDRGGFNGSTRNLCNMLCVPALIAAMLFLSACTTVGPDFMRPEAPAQEEWTEPASEKVKMEPDDHSQWWLVFNDPALNTLIETAYNQNLSLQIAGLRIIEARAQLGIAVGNLFPQAQAGAVAYTYSEQSENAPPVSSLPAELRQNVSTDAQLFRLGADASWEIDFWGRFRRGIESANADLAAMVADYDGVLVTLTADVANLYILVRTFEERLIHAQENVKIQQRSFEITDVRFRNGATTELDVRQAEALLRSTQASIPNLLTGLRQAKNALCTLLAMPPDDLQEIMGDAGTIPMTPSQIAMGIPAEMLRRRPDIRSAEYQAAAQSAKIGIAKADLYPSFSLSGFFGAEADDGGNLFTSASLTGFITPAFRWNILNYGRIKNNVRVQDARFQQLVTNYENTVLNAYREVEDAMVGYLHAMKEVEFLTLSVKAAERSVKVALIQYRDGVTNYTTVLRTQEVLVAQQDNLTRTRGVVTGDLILLYKALGGGWQIREGKPFITADTKVTMQARTDWGGLLPPDDLPDESKPLPSASDISPLQSVDW